MASIERMITGLVDYTCEDLEQLERERPELGRVEIVDGALHATGESAVGDLHQLIIQRLFLLFAPLCPPDQILRIDTWWMSHRRKIRADSPSGGPGTGRPTARPSGSRPARSSRCSPTMAATTP